MRLIALSFGSLIFLGFLLAFFAAPIVQAQTEEPPENVSIPKTHIVEAGENLTYIADQYGVSVFAMQVVNHLRDSDVLQVGQELIIPGGEGDSIVTLYATEIGDSLGSIAGSFNSSVEELMAANRLINADYVPVTGQVLALISRNGSEEPQRLTGELHIVGPGETLLEIAATHDTSVSAIMNANDLNYPANLFPGQRLRIPGGEPYQDLPGSWSRLSIRPGTPTQGDTVVITVSNLLSGQPSGTFAGQTLNFFPDDDEFSALVGIDAFTEPGLYTLELEGSGEQPWQPFDREIRISSANYSLQNIEVPESLESLLEPAVRENEDAFLKMVFANYTEDKQWQGLFQLPVTNTIVTAPYGGARSYNEYPVTIYHTGTDFGGDVGTPILAAADGVVVFSDMLEIRGQTVILDHGLGVMTGYYHLSERLVETGDTVIGGEPVGKGGSSGLSTGPHLHWDLRIMDIPVDGVVWTEEEFP